MSHSEDFLAEVQATAAFLGQQEKLLETMAEQLRALRARKGRLFLLGLGGGAANASHAVNDFRKLCGIEAYCVTDNVAEFSARVNDEGLDGLFREWLMGCRLTREDAVMVFSVGGGAGMISRCIIHATEFTKEIGAPLLGVVGKPDGAVATQGDCVVVVPLAVNKKWLTPVTEAFQGVVLHLLVSHPQLQENDTRW